MKSSTAPVGKSGFSVPCGRHRTLPSIRTTHSERTFSASEKGGQRAESERQRAPQSASGFTRAQQARQPNGGPNCDADCQLAGYPYLGLMTVHFPFDNSYAALPEGFFARVVPTPVPAPKLVK